MEAIRTVHGGGQFNPPLIATRLGERLIAPLSPREIEGPRHLAPGLCNREIAVRTGLVVGTKKLHVASEFSKLNVPDRNHARVIAGKRGAIDIE